MQLIRLFCLIIAALICDLSISAEEKISHFRVSIEVEVDGDLIITEELTLIAEGKQIRRGIFRDLPRYYRDDKTGGHLPYQYDVRRVARNGLDEPYTSEKDGNAWRLRIGNPDQYLPHGEHTYLIEYRVKNQIRYFEAHDELYWNITGHDWSFPVLKAEAIITLPEGARVTEAVGYTGRYGQALRDYTYRPVGNDHIFETARPLARNEGLTVSLSVAKGLIEPPSYHDRGWLWWARYGSLTVLIASFLGLLGYYRVSFERVGQDPIKPPVFPQYQPPEGYSPAAVHHIYHRFLSGHGALIASLMQLAIGGYLKIDLDDKLADENTTSLTLIRRPDQNDDVPADTLRLVDELFLGQSKIAFDGKPNPVFVSHYDKYREYLGTKYGKPYFRWNIGYLILGGGMTLAGSLYAVFQTSFWTFYHTGLILALIGLNGLFMYLMPAPTRKGQAIRTQIEGLRLYMEKAEALQLNSVEAGGDAPPPMTKERYEAFLPYAIALGVEKPWSRHFEKLIPEEAATYQPGWGDIGRGRARSLGGLTEGIVSGISSGVRSAQPQSSSSSGSGGGGFSGGGGGGGGGGGW